MSVLRALGTSAGARRSRRPTRARQRPLFFRAMPTYSCNACRSPRRKEGISPTPAPAWLPNLTTRCSLCLDCPPGETSRFPRGKLANMSEVTQILSAIEQGDARVGTAPAAGPRGAARAGGPEAGPRKARPDAASGRPGPQGLPAPGGRRARRPLEQPRALPRGGSGWPTASTARAECDITVLAATSAFPGVDR